MTLITLKSSNNNLDLQLLRSRLEAAGINYFLKNELTTQILSTSPGFETELQVAEEDLEKALQIMREIESE